MARVRKISGIDCNAHAFTGICVVLTSRFEEMWAFRDSALNWSDPEGVHAMRVCSRRLRCTLRDFSSYIQKRHLKSLPQRIKRVADALGLVRDQDVAIIALERLARQAPAELSQDILAFVEARQAIREGARNQLIEVLDPDHLERLRSDFVEAIENATLISSPNKRSKQPQSTSLTYRKVARDIVLQRLEEMEKLSDSLFRPLKVAPLHEARIAAKNLRYCLELFEHCWGTPMSKMARKLAVLQSSLGKIHDCDVWIESFGDDLIGKGVRKLDRQNLSASRRLSWVWLLNHFLKIRSKHLRDALLFWNEWQTLDLGTQLRTMVRK